MVDAAGVVELRYAFLDTTSTGPARRRRVSFCCRIAFLLKFLVLPWVRLYDERCMLRRW